jgi:hypothetical protein
MKLKVIAIAALLFYAVSCKKENLNPQPETQLLDAVAFSTPERVEQQVRGMYAAVKSGQFYGGRLLVYNEVRGEDFINRTQNGVTAFQAWNFTETPTTNEVQNLWGAGFAAINRVNVVFSRLADAPISDSLKRQYEGEARFLRALSYFGLVTMYARPYWDNNGNNPGLPLRLQAETQPGTNDLPRSTVAEVYQQIIQDLNSAETLLPLNYGSTSASALNTTRAHRNTAIALKTRVFLNMRNYQSVITEANKIVPNAEPFQAATGVRNRLEPDVRTVFPLLGGSPATLENIFSLPFTSLDLPGTQNGLGSYFNPGPAGLGDYVVNVATGGIAADSTNWRTTDARRDYLVRSGTLTYLRKWPNSPHTDWIPIIRYSEVMLNLAEALARTGTSVNQRALELVSAIRKRSDPTMTLTATSQEQLINIILRERRIELMGEGFRALDIMRLGLTFPAKSGGGLSAPAVGPNSPQYIWPIPLSELLVNRAIVQNQGY